MKFNSKKEYADHIQMDVICGDMEELLNEIIYLIKRNKLVSRFDFNLYIVKSLSISTTMIVVKGFDDEFIIDDIIKTNIFKELDVIAERIKGYCKDNTIEIKPFTDQHLSAVRLTREYLGLHFLRKDFSNE